MTPIKIKHLPAFLRAIEPIAHDLAAGDLLGSLTRHADAVITATALGADVDRAWLDEQTPDVLIDLASQVIEVNTDFFAHSVLPKLTVAADRLAIVTGGTPGLPASSGQASATPT
ncbi:MAG: hypothetical protein CTY22_05215 [Methylomonas sp.]|nr:MAG: hypothetical protein CTY23_00640 [Methylomonas sp.]PPD26420.1 MAG: hypothetical protein CTY22_05215 [Methylomonas sp.]PPD38169.1 MAG: hypothetical protein CTY21_05210 [Methylomonas sp.]PPD41843.1 MAG: hypothetical protein CTY17_02915 [Methylomonas sp.]PPD51603.1 MAG: hypothetical protein CTY11_11850 [Methylomonas sp.]